jgi:hypothetical protein
MRNIGIGTGETSGRVFFQKISNLRVNFNRPLLSGIQTSASESRRNILDDQLEPVHVDYATSSRERILL